MGVTSSTRVGPEAALSRSDAKRPLPARLSGPVTSRVATSDHWPEPEDEPLGDPVLEEPLPDEPVELDPLLPAPEPVVPVVSEPEPLEPLPPYVLPDEPEPVVPVVSEPEPLEPLPP